MSSLLLAVDGEERLGYLLGFRHLTFYANGPAGWVEDGRTAHYAVVPASDADLVDAWFRLGFGQQQVHAVRPVGPREAVATQGFQIRPGRGIFCTRDLRERDAVALSQQTNRFRKCDVLDEHRKLENIAANPAAEAHEDLFFGIHVEGRGLFVVKRAARDVVPASLFEGDVLGNERDDID